MLLHRIGDRLEQTGTNYEAEGAHAASLTLRGFGAGLQRNSDFYLRFEWEDVEALIGIFASQNHPEAKRIRNSAALVDALKSALSLD